MIHTCTIKKRMRQQNLAFTAGSGTAAVGQTVTGSSGTPLVAHATAVIVALGTGLLQVKDLVGTFGAGDHLTTTTWSGTFASIADAAKTAGKYWEYWATDQSGVMCRFYQAKTGRGILILLPGAVVDQPLKCALPPTVNITQKTAKDYIITTTETQFAGTYFLSKFYPFSAPFGGVDHFEAELRPDVDVT